MFGALHTRIRRAAVVLASTLVVIGSVVGLAAPAEAITNGKPTSPFSYPYYVRLRVYKYTSQFQYATCGGSLIDSQWILTAAHCMTEGAQKQSIGVQAWILDNCGVSAVELRIHPLRDGDWSNGHDLALVRIPNGTAHCVGPTRSQVYPKPVQVGDVSDTAAYAAGAAATIVGHGATSSGGKVTNELRYLWTSLRSDGDMSDVYDHIWSTNWNSRLMIGRATVRTRRATVTAAAHSSSTARRARSRSAWRASTGPGATRRPGSPSWPGPSRPGSPPMCLTPTSAAALSTTARSPAAGRRRTRSQAPEPSSTDPSTTGSPASGRTRRCPRPPCRRRRRRWPPPDQCSLGNQGRVVRTDGTASARQARWAWMTISAAWMSTCVVSQAVGDGL